MFGLPSPDPAYASKAAWRFIVLAYSLVLFVAVALFTADWWMPLFRNSPSLFVDLVSLIIATAFSFALAAVGWASLGLRDRAPSEQRAAWAAFSASVATLLLLTVALLFLTGIIRLP